MTSTMLPKAARPVTPTSILVAMLEELVARATSLPILDASFLQSLSEARSLASGLELYCETETTAPSSCLSALNQATRDQAWSDRHASGETSLPLEQEMLSGHLEGQFLRMLVLATGARRILEIGLFSGYSALAMAEALPRDGSLIACEIDAFAAAFAREWIGLSPHASKVDIRVGAAQDILEQLEQEGKSFDFVFLDADKGGYVAYFELLVGTSLLAPGGMICVDNTLMQGQPWLDGAPSANGLAIRDFNRHVSADGRVEQVLLPVRDGVTLIRRSADDRGSPSGVAKAMHP